MSASVIAAVTGDIAHAQLGPTPANELLYCDISHSSGKVDKRMMRFTLIADELSDSRRTGGGLIVEFTPEGIGRDAAKLLDISLTS